MPIYQTIFVSKGPRTCLTTNNRWTGTPASPPSMTHRHLFTVVGRRLPKTSDSQIVNNRPCPQRMWDPTSIRQNVRTRAAFRNDRPMCREQKGCCSRIEDDVDKRRQRCTGDEKGREKFISSQLVFCACQTPTARKLLRQRNPTRQSFDGHRMFRTKIS